MISNKTIEEINKMYNVQRNDKGEIIYYENFKGVKYWNSYDESGNIVNHKNSLGLEWTREYNENDKETYYKCREYECWRTYNDKGDLLTFKNNKGLNYNIKDRELPELPYNSYSDRYNEIIYNIANTITNQEIDEVKSLILGEELTVSNIKKHLQEGYHDIYYHFIPNTNYHIFDNIPKEESSPDLLSILIIKYKDEEFGNKIKSSIIEHINKIEDVWLCQEYTNRNIDEYIFSKVDINKDFIEIFNYDEVCDFFHNQNNIFDLVYINKKFFKVNDKYFKKLDSELYKEILNMNK